MRNVFVIFLALSLLGCNYQENLNKIRDDLRKDSLLQVKRKDSIKSQNIYFATLRKKFKKWIEPDSKDTTFIHPFFINDILYSDYVVILKTLPDRLSMLVEKHHYNGYLFRNLEITRTDMNTTKYYMTTYFKLNITDSLNNNKSYIFKELSSSGLDLEREIDTIFFKTIIKHRNEKLQVEEYFARVETGHFEGEEKPDDKKVRSFYLSKENKLAIIESYNFYVLLRNLTDN